MQIQTDTIIIPSRQREPEIDDFFVASIAKRLIQPIVLRQTDEGPTLVVGARRLLAMKQLKFDILVENEHFRFLHDLSPEEAEIVELEENIKRVEMDWRDYVRAVAKIHKLYRAREGWTNIQIADELSIHEKYLYKLLLISRKIDSPALKEATGISHAYRILQVIADRVASDIVGKISDAGKEVSIPASQPIPLLREPSPEEIEHAFTSLPDKPASIETTKTPELKPITTQPEPEPILNQSFQTWLETYTGPKFNLIHCDFPYGVDYQTYAASVTSTKEDYDTSAYNDLLEVFCSSLDKFCSYQAHVVFWFSMEFYERTRIALETAGLSVHRHPLIWFKSDNSGIIPGRDNQYTRRVYETAFLCSRGGRPLIKTLANLYAAPGVSNPIHPTQKSESMLRHFFTMLVDEATDVFDPTCGSGSALRVAESLKARRVLGLEVDSNHARRANQATITARQMRKATQ